MQRAQLVLERHHLDQGVDLRRRLAALIAQLAFGVVERLLGRRRCQPLVEEQPLLHVGDVIVRDQRRDGQLHVGLEVLADLLALERGNRFLHQLRVQVEPDRGDVATLIRSEQVAGAADLQIVRGDLEAGAQLGELLQHLKALLGIAGDPPPGRNQQICIRALAAAADAPADLVELREAEVVRPVDEDGVRRRDVEAALDDGGAEEHVVLPVHELRHHSFQLPLGHLSVGHRDLRLRHELRQVVQHAGDGLDAVVQEEDLPPAGELPLDGLLDRAAVELGNEGADRAPIHRRRADDRQIAHAHHRHVQGARDGRRGEREHVDELAQLLQLLLVLDAEALLLVHHHQPQVLEGDVRGEETVGADQHVDLALPRALEDLADLLVVAVARDHLHRDRVVREALREGPEVLGGEHRRRHQQGDLLLVLHRLEGGPERDLRLAIAHVAADQAVHRLFVLHVDQDLADRALLIGGLFELEVRFELAVHRVRRRIRVALVGGARGVDVEQLGGHLEQLFLDPRLALLEGLALERIELDLLGVASRVFLDLSQAPDRKVQPVLAGEVEQDEIGCKSPHIQAGEAVVARDPVVDVHDQVAFLEVAEVGALRAERARPPRGPAGLGAGPEDVLVREDRQAVVRIDEARADLPHHQVRVQMRREGGLLEGHDLRHQIPVQQQPPRSLRLGRGVARDHRGASPLTQRLQPPHQGRERPVLAVVALDLGPQVAGRPQIEVDLDGADGSVRAHDEAGQLEHRG